VECARQRYNLGHFYFTGHRCVEKLMTGFRIDGRTIVKMLTRMHMVFYTWWCWHICKGEGVGVGVDQLGEEKCFSVFSEH
jgi:hypothetical protein